MTTTSTAPRKRESTVYADTFFFLASINHNDAHHARAIDFSARFDGELVTSEMVLVETANALASVSARKAYVELESALRGDSRVRVVPTTAAINARALDLYSRANGKDWSLTDCVSFIIMSDERLVMALTGDVRFEQAGFTAVLK